MLPSNILLNVSGLASRKVDPAGYLELKEFI
jgi:hypothetical protein